MVGPATGRKNAHGTGPRNTIYAAVACERLTVPRAFLRENPVRKQTLLLLLSVPAPSRVLEVAKVLCSFPVRQEARIENYQVKTAVLGCEPTEHRMIADMHDVSILQRFEQYDTHMNHTVQYCPVKVLTECVVKKARQKDP